MRRMVQGGATVGEEKRHRRKARKGMTLNGALLLLRNGKISFTDFQSVTHNTWWRLAQHLYKRWKPPTGVDVADVYQELLLAAWVFVPQWDPSRGNDIERYVVWNASDKAKKSLHKLRGAKLSGNADSNPTRSEGVMDLYELPEEVVEENETVMYQRIERAGQLSKGATPAETTVLFALARNFNVNLAADTLYANYRTRLSLRLGSEDASRRLVCKVIRSTSKRIAA